MGNAKSPVANVPGCPGGPRAIVIMHDAVEAASGRRMSPEDARAYLRENAVQFAETTMALAAKLPSANQN